MADSNVINIYGETDGGKISVSVGSWQNPSQQLTTTFYTSQTIPCKLRLFPETLEDPPYVRKNDLDITSLGTLDATTNMYLIALDDSNVSNGDNIYVGFKDLTKPAVPNCKIEVPCVFKELWIEKSDGSVVNVTSKLLS